MDWQSLPFVMLRQRVKNSLIKDQIANIWGFAGHTIYVPIIHHALAGIDWHFWACLSDLLVLFQVHFQFAPAALPDLLLVGGVKHALQP